MYLGFRSLLALQNLHARAIAIKAEPDISNRRRRRADAGPTEACRAFDSLERNEMRLLQANVDEDFGLQAELVNLEVEQQGFLYRLCEPHAATMRGHRPRMVAFASGNARNLVHRVDSAEATENLMRPAIIRNTTGAGGGP